MCIELSLIAARVGLYRIDYAAQYIGTVLINAGIQMNGPCAWIRKSLMSTQALRCNYICSVTIPVLQYIRIQAEDC